jgi:hypothetical protein
MYAYTTYRKLGAAILALGLSLVWLGPAGASPELEKEVGKFARKIKNFLDSRNEKDLTLGEFNGPPQLEANPGPGLIKLLGDELKKLGVTIKGGAKLGLTGEFRPVEDEESKSLGMELKVRIVNNFGRPQQVLSCGILGAPDIAVLAGLSVELKMTEDADQRKKQLEKALDKAELFVRGTTVTNKATTPYAVEVLVNSDARQPELTDNRAYVDLERGEIYTIRLHNRSNREAGVLLAIDGINVFAFNEDPEKDGSVRKEFHIIVPKKGVVEIKGWYHKGGKSHSFQVTGYPESAVAQLGLKSSSRVGQITAVFKACWAKGENPPPEESGALSGNYTGLGPPVAEDYGRLERTFGRMRAAITVRYNKK